MLRDELFHNPSTVFLGCLAWIPLAIWVISFVGWMINGDVDGLTGFLGILGTVALGAVITKPPAQNLAPVGFLAIVTISVMFPFVRRAINRHQLRLVDVDAIERAYEVMKVRPNNPGSRMRIARHLHNLGFPSIAIPIMDSALKDVPVQFFRDEFMLLQMWRSGGAVPAASLECPICGMRNDPGLSVICTRCQAPYLLDRLRGRIMSASLGRRLLGIWMLLVSITVGISSTPALSVPWNIIVGILCLGAIGFGILLIVKEPKL